MIRFMSLSFAVLGFYVITLRLLFFYTRQAAEHKIIRDSKMRAYFLIFLSFLAWAISSGLRGLVLVWGFTGGQSLLIQYCYNGIIGLALFILGWPIFQEYSRLLRIFNANKWTRNERFILIMILLVMCLYLYRVLVPWADDDETRYYGFITKMIASGRSLGNLIGEAASFGFVRSQLVQCWDALLYGLVNDDYLVRLNRFINLLFCGAGIFSFLRLMGISRLWSLIGLLAFFSTPELSYLALSLKVDSVVMMFELAAFLSIIMASFICERDRCSINVFQASFFLSTAGLLLAAFSFGSRFSGIIPMLLCSGFGVYFLNQLIRRPFLSFFIVLLLFILFTFISSPGYWANYLVYQNPTYPTKGFWPFQNGEYLETMEQWKSWNIVGLPPVILQCYLVFAVGAGIELLAKFLPILNCLPMAVYKMQSMGWPYPIILSVFLWPFFRSNFVINLIVSIFIYQLFGWSLGLHYSRIFVASATLMVLAAVMMADQRLCGKGMVVSTIQKILKAWVVFSLIISIFLQAWWLAKRYYGVFLFTPSGRYQATVKFLQKIGSIENAPTFDEAQRVSLLLQSRQDYPVLFIESPAWHVLFDARIHVKQFTPNNPFMGGGNYILLSPGLMATPSIQRDLCLHFFPVHVSTMNESKWQLYTVSNRNSFTNKTDL